MIFSIRDLAFEIGSLYLEGWLALAARCVCALLLFAAGVLVSLLLRRKIFPILQARSWHFAATPILLRSLDRPLERMAVFTGLYLALTSLPWAITGLPKFLLVAYKVVMSFLFCEGLYQASDVADLLLASCSLEIRSNKTLLALLNTTYKVLVVVLGVATIAQVIGFPIGSAGAGLVGLTISLAAQESASNLFGGLVILLDKPFSVGDWITVGEIEGEVIDINFRSTRIRAMDKDHAGRKPLYPEGQQHRPADQLWRFQHQHSGFRLSSDERLCRLPRRAERPEPEHHGHHAGRRRGLCLPLHQRLHRKVRLLSCTLPLPLTREFFVYRQMEFSCIALTRPHPAPSSAQSPAPR